MEASLQMLAIAGNLGCWVSPSVCAGRAGIRSSFSSAPRLTTSTLGGLAKQRERMQRALNLWSWMHLLCALEQRHHLGWYGSSGCSVRLAGNLINI
ncbi:hypothetical protein WJX74_003963 [Apatococcus lobatus]|uniref:Secreted protein n=1 Tax=Apatococcus lobatus TaxID=904363 RepID=A0AAW1Q5W5_9CHLO